MNDPQNQLRQSIEHSLHAPTVNVLPVLLDDATMPSMQALPEALHNLTQRMALKIDTDEKFQQDMESVHDVLDSERVPGIRGVTFYGVIIAMNVMLIILIIIAAALFYFGTLG